MSPLYSVPTNPGQMEWDIVSIEDDPMSISDSSDEESDISDEESNTSDEGSNRSDEGSVVEDPVEDDDLHDIQAMLDAIKEELSDEEDLVIEEIDEKSPSDLVR